MDATRELLEEENAILQHKVVCVCVCVYVCVCVCVCVCVYLCV